MSILLSLKVLIADVVRSFFCLLLSALRISFFSSVYVITEDNFVSCLQP